MSKSAIYVGHRGCKIGYGVENTKRAFGEAAIYGFQAIETDIRVTRDGIFIASHDPTLARLTTYNGDPLEIDVQKTNFDEFKDICLCEMFNGRLREGDTIATFDDYLSVCRKFKVLSIIELKWTKGIYSNNDDPNDYDYSKLDDLVKKVREYELDKTTYIISSMKGCLQHVRDNNPDMKLQWLCSTNYKEGLDWCVKNNINIDIEYHSCTKELVDFCHKNNLIINIWTLDDSNELKKFLDMGVDMITSNLISNDQYRNGIYR